NYIIISNNPEILEINDHTVKGVSEGTAILRFTSNNNLVSEQSVNVKPVDPYYLSVKCLDQIHVGDKKKCDVFYSPINITHKDFAWESSNPKVLGIDSNGWVVGKQIGESTITVRHKPTGKTASYDLSVVPIPVESIELTGDKSCLPLRESLQLNATIIPKNATDQGIEWLSSDETVATVTPHGIVKGLKPGIVVITAATNNGINDTYVLEILGKNERKGTPQDIDIPVEEVLLSGDTHLITKGESLQLKATVVPLNATEQKVEWGSSDNTVATVTSDGKVTGINAGSAFVYATSQNGKKAYYIINVWRDKLLPISPRPVSPQVADVDAIQSANVKTMKVVIYCDCDDYNHVGNEWGFSFYINGEEFTSGDTVKLSPGDTISVTSTIWEDENVPDVGEETTRKKITQEELESGFKIEQIVDVEENRGRYSGNVASWYVTYRFYE
ncbi:MAG: Ig domain-containing protein, partial [Firmicutes bacterium]|nr:Ig domain-containing protein [Bacillota bacterium]